MKTLSAVIKILSFIDALVLLAFVGFLVYDWITISQTNFAGTVEFWMVVEFYTKCLLATSFIGFAFSLSNVFINVESSKTLSKVMSFVFGAVFVISFVLQIFCKVG